MRTLIAIVLVICANGCRKSAPTLAGGKPVEHWINSLRDDDPQTRKTAAFKLGNVGTADSAAIPALINALRDNDATVRCEAIRALVKSGRNANSATPALDELREQDPDATVRDYAAKALETIDAGSRK
jgi:HEAT repeat protein